MKKTSASFMQEMTEVFDDLEQTLIAYEKKEGDTHLLERLFELWHTVKVLLTVLGLTSLAGLGGLVLGIFEKHRNEQETIPEEMIDLSLATIGFLSSCLHTLLAKNLMPRPQAEESYQKELDSFSTKWEAFLPSYSAYDQRNEVGVTKRKRPRVLIVDDEVINRTLLEEAIQKTSQEIDIVSVGSAEEGLYHYFTSHFDLVFLDIMMPNIDGNHFINIVQKNRSAGLLKSPPNIVVQTAVDSMDHLVSYARRECIQEVIRKPLPFDRIKECVERYCLEK